LLVPERQHSRVSFALPAEVRARLSAAIADPAMPDYLAIRAHAALSKDNRVGRLTAMDAHFVADARRRAREFGAPALLADAPTMLERILEIATQQLVAYTPRGFAMGKVSAESGVARRTLYNLYRNSDDLADACRRRAQTLWRARFEQTILRADQRPVQRLFGTINAIDAWVQSERFRHDELLRARALFANDIRSDDLRLHFAEIDSFATMLAVDACVRTPRVFGAFVATTVAGASAWFDRRRESQAASVALVERLIARQRRC
jgi:AcrR family transcriptional regulator